MSVDGIRYALEAALAATRQAELDSAFLDDVDLYVQEARTALNVAYGHMDAGKRKLYLQRQCKRRHDANKKAKRRLRRTQENPKWNG